MADTPVGPLTAASDIRAVVLRRGARRFRCRSDRLFVVAGTSGRVGDLADRLVIDHVDRFIIGVLGRRRMTCAIARFAMTSSEPSATAMRTRSSSTETIVP